MLMQNGFSANYPDLHPPAEADLRHGSGGTQSIGLLSDICKRALRLSAALTLVSLLVAMAGGGPAAAQNGLAAAVCDAPAALIALEAPLPRVAARVAAGQPLRVVALGSSSTEGVGASGPEFSYPSRLADELALRFPGIEAVVMNRGVAGQDAAAMLARLERDVLAERPDLVIWQLGTAALLHGHGWNYNPVLAEGLRRLRHTGVDVVAMDPQYAPALLSHPGHEAAVRQIGDIANAHGAGVFRRFAIMRHWVEGGLAFDQILAPDRLHPNDFAHGCLARLLAQAIHQATR